MKRLLMILLFMASVIPSMSQEASRGSYYTLRAKPHEDLKKTILDFAKQRGIKAGAIVSCAGSLEQYNIRFANQENGSKAKGFFEIVSLSGTFSDSSSHIHISVADKSGKTIGGHLLDDNLIYTTAEIVLLELTDVEFTRETDSTYGYKELVVKKKKQ